MRKPIRIKDPLYGYIEIEDTIVYTIINSAEFHRLQDIIQTSYSSVYPTCLHNRFIHSIGVYYLGLLSISGIEKNSDIDKYKNFNELKKTFLLACLMHDLGHAPFSHTGEYFYEAHKKDGISVPRKDLNDILDEAFKEDYKNKLAGAPHEVMSALEGLKVFSKTIDENYKSFFARCIIGLKYTNKHDLENCFIELLNSKTIDVDKLDYLLRDSYYSGFKTVNIDYNRLLGSLCIIEKNGHIELGFTKAALSTLESVILAHDMERKWVQNHPTIQYENALVRHMLNVVINDCESKGLILFSLQALTEEGITSDKQTVHLLSDADIISMAKQFYSSDSLIREYFNRGIRRKALWKSESEYRILFEQSSLSEGAVKKLEEKFDSILRVLQNKFPIIDDKLLTYIDTEIQNINSLTGIFNDEVKNAKLKEFVDLRDLLLTIKSFSEKKGYKFNYSLISTTQFLSSFNKEELKNISIKFDDKTINKLGATVNLFEQTNKPREKFFYFYASYEDREDFDVYDFRDMLFKYAFDHYQ